MSPSLRLFMVAWSALWNILLVGFVAYIGFRALKDRRYGANILQRFGWYGRAVPDGLPGAVWVHAVSLGEMRSAVPLIRAVLARGDNVVVTVFTPAGMGAARETFADEIAQDRVCAVWVPIETSWAYRRFFKAFRPAFGLVMEIEIWPRMVCAARDAGVELFMCNAQYPVSSFARDGSGWLRLRQQVMRQYAGAFVKSELQQQRFAAAGVRNIHVTGELRFDQDVPKSQLIAGGAARAWLMAEERRVVVIASSIEGEDDCYLSAISALRRDAHMTGAQAPLFVYVPRRPERFDAVARMIAAEGLVCARRSDLWSSDLSRPLHQGEAPPVDVLLGDSLGEMWFYLAMGDQVVVGGGFRPAGAHNIIEPLMLKKPVITGSNTHTIEYPFVEAAASGVAHSVNDADELAQALLEQTTPDVAAIEAFLAAHSGATAKTMAAIDRARHVTSSSR